MFTFPVGELLRALLLVGSRLVRPRLTGRLAMHVLTPATLPALVEAAYSLFAPYPIGSTLSVCKACCVSEAEERELVNTPLRAVSRQLLDDAYYASARNYSDQERGEMKHFLPRVLELVTQFEFPCHSLEITFARLDLDQPAYWLPGERQLLAAFASAYFQACLARYPLPTGDSLAAILPMFGRAHFDLSPLLHAWETSNTVTSLAHLTDLLVDELSYTPPKPLQLANPFTLPHVDQQLAAWLRNPAIRASLTEQVAHAFCHQPLPDELATRASWAYEVLTQGLP